MGGNLGGARKYSPEAHATIVDWIRKGNSRTDAFKLVGINHQTGFDWIAQGRREPHRYPEYVQLLEDIEEAEAQVKAEMVEIVVGAAKSDPKHWTAAMTYLERRDPDNWGKRDTTVIEGGQTPLIQLNQIVLQDDQTRQLSRDMLRRTTELAHTPFAIEAGSSDDAGHKGEGES